MTNKDIYLSLNRQDETSVKKLLTNHKLEKEYTYNNDYIEVVLKNNNKDKISERDIVYALEENGYTDSEIDSIMMDLENEQINNEHQVNKEEVSKQEINKQTKM